MASAIIRMTSQMRTLDDGLFSSHSGDVVIYQRRAEDGSIDEWHIYAASPTEANFNEAPVGSYLYDTATPATVKRHLTATTWGSVTYS